jgi:hypothetical protein
MSDNSFFSMFSILIPIYNFDVREFINELHSQCIQENIVFEILLADDASEKSFREINKSLGSLSNVQYIQLETNIGRSKIRNYLAEMASYDWLFFADCDSAIRSKNFIKKYIEQLDGKDVICGGRSYTEAAPKNPKEYLRWYYGIHREYKTAKERNKHPNRSFMTNNYVITKLVHKQIKFDENISQYGHEDTLFGIELKRHKIHVKHIDNYLEHIGLEDNTIFVKKTETGIQNLVYIIREYEYPELFEDIKLLRIYTKTKYLSFLFNIFISPFGRLIKKQLYTNKPSLKLFDFYKLSFLHSAASIK